MARSTPGEQPNANEPGVAPQEANTLAPWDQPEQIIKALSAAWRSATDHETPTLNQLSQTALRRVDVDETSGYVSVVTADETYRAIGIRRDLVAPMVSLLCHQPVADVRVVLARGPAKIEVAAQTARSRRPGHGS